MLTTFPRYTSTIMASCILGSSLANFPLLCVCHNVKSGLLPEDLLTSVDIGGHRRQDFTPQVIWIMKMTFPIDLMMTQD